MFAQQNMGIREKQTGGGGAARAAVRLAEKLWRRRCSRRSVVLPRRRAGAAGGKWTCSWQHLIVLHSAGTAHAMGAVGGVTHVYARRTLGGSCGIWR